MGFDDFYETDKLFKSNIYSKSLRINFSSRYLLNVLYDLWICVGGYLLQTMRLSVVIYEKSNKT